MLKIKFEFWRTTTFREAGAFTQKLTTRFQGLLRKCFQESTEGGQVSLNLQLFLLHDPEKPIVRRTCKLLELLWCTFHSDMIIRGNSFEKLDPLASHDKIVFIAANRKRKHAP